VPVYNPVPWLIDTDCLLSTTSYGQFFAVGSERRIRARRVNAAAVRARQELMLSHYLNDYCKAILFWTEYGRRRDLGILEDRQLLSEDDLACLEAKSDVLYPTVPAVEPAPKSEKISVVYMGRTYEHKGGAIALSVFRKLRKEYGDDLGLTFIGEAPASARKKQVGIQFLPTIDQKEYFSILERSHIFISPTKSESYGMGLLEAAARGMAILTTSGPGMEPVEEILAEDRNAFYVQNDLTAGEKAARFLSYIRMLVENQEKLKEMREDNYRLFRSGKLSMENMKQKLLTYYEKMERNGSSKESESVGSQIERLSRDRGFSMRYLPESMCTEMLGERTGGRSVAIRL
jgi:glycosyltransferase involved in cell wall biosynthesis